MNWDWPSTLIEAVDRLMSTLTPDELDAIGHMSEGELISLHFSLGMRIRNEFGLWQGNDDLLASCCPDVTDPYMLMIIKHDPDGASGRIIDALWKRLQTSE
jgi:hypothetical protein